MATIAVIHGGDSGHPSAKPFYKMFPKERILPEGTVNVDKIVEFTGSKPKLAAVLKLVKSNCSAGDNLLLVSHGVSNDGGHLLIHPKDGVTFYSDVIKVFLNALDDKIEDKDGAKMINSMSVKSFTQIKKLVEDIRALRLNQIIIRACNVAGEGTTLLEHLKKLFAVKNVCGPTQMDTYIRVPPDIGADEFDKFKKNYPDFVKIQESPLIAYQRKGSGLKYKFGLYAENKTALKSWLMKHYSTSPTDLSKIYLHGFLEGFGTAKILLPGDTGYTDTLRIV